MTILSTSAGLLCIFVFLIHRFGKCLFISNLGSAHVSFHLKLTQKSVHDDFKMQLAHTCDDGLSRLLVRMGTEGRVFFCQFCQSLTHLTLSCLRLRLDCQLDNRFREFHGLKDNRMLIIANGITRGRKFESYCRRDIPGINLIKLCPLIRMHLQDTSHTFLFVLRCVQYIGT